MIASAYSLPSWTAAASMSAERMGASSVPCLAVALLIDT